MANEVISIALQLVDNFTNGLSLITRQVDSFASKANNLASAFAPVSLAAGVALGGSVKLAMDYDKALQSAGKAMDLNKQQLQGLDKDINRIQRELGYAFGATTIANVVATAGKLGLAKEQAEGFVKTALKAAVALDVKNVDEFVTNFAKVRNAFKMTQQVSEEYIAALNMLDDRYAVTGEQLVNYSQRVSGVAKSFGFSAKEAMVWGNAMINAGAAPNVAATAFNKFAQTLGAARVGTDKQEAGFKKLGLTTEQVAQMMNTSANGAMLNIFNRIKQLDSITQKDVIGQLFGQEHVDSGNQILAQLDVVESSIKMVNNTTLNAIKLNNEFYKQLNTVAGQAGALKNVTQSLGISLGKVLLPGIVSVAQAISPLLDSLAQLVQKHPEISALIAGALGIVAILAPLAAITSAIAGLIPLIAGIAKAIAVVVGVVVSAPGLAVVAIAAVIAAVAYGASEIVKNWDSISRTINNVWNSAIQSTQRFFSWIDAGIKSNMNAIANWGNNIVNSMGNAISNAAKPFVSFFNWLEQSFNNFGSNAYNWGASIVSNFIKGFQSLYSNVTQMLTNWTNYIRSFLPGSDADRGAFSTLTQSGVAFGETFMRGIEQSGFYNAMSGLSTPASGLRPAYAGGGSGNVINFNPQYTITASNSDDIIKKLAVRDKALLDLINRSTTKNTRSMY